MGRGSSVPRIRGGWHTSFCEPLDDKPITIYGDGCQVRDALFVGCGRCLVARARSHRDRISGRIFNLGGGPANTTSLLEAIDLIAKISGLRPRLKFADWRPGDQPGMFPISGPYRGLHRHPGTSLDRGLRDLHHWIRERFFADLDLAGAAGSAGMTLARHFQMIDLEVSR